VSVINIPISNKLSKHQITLQMQQCPHLW